MILYLDTSSLVKLYVEENYSENIKTLVLSSDVVATSLIAYAEARAAFARRFREKAFSSKEFNLIKKCFETDWNNFLGLLPGEETIRLAGELAEKHALRGFDSIHLASAVLLRDQSNSPVLFSCFDHQLQKAAHNEALIIPQSSNY